MNENQKIKIESVDLDLIVKTRTEIALSLHKTWPSAFNTEAMDKIADLAIRLADKLSTTPIKN